MIMLKNPAQIEKMRSAGKLLYEVEQQVRRAIKPGVTTADLDVLAEQLIRKGGAIPSEKGYEGYPCSICASVNDEVVHGIPSDRRVLREGDIITVDCTLKLDGWQADSAFTVGVGQISEEAMRLIIATEESFWQGIRQCVAGNRLGDVGHAVASYVRALGYAPIQAYTGHGIGREMHEDPSVPNDGEPGRGFRLRKGMTIAVEPMIAQGDWHINTDPDGWTARTRDGKLCSHYEHTIAINEEGLPDILTLPGFSWEHTPLNEKGFPRVSHLAGAETEGAL
ncbi:MAG: type I methionyl aminopeptidase [Clostridia bacterium]|nr:type I methionyl aminopeptidase [Clostridia bacterium]